MKEAIIKLMGGREIRLLVPDRLKESEVYKEIYQRFREVYLDMEGLDFKAMRERYVRQRN